MFFCLLKFFWCPSMEIDVVVSDVQHNGALLPDVISFDPMLLPSGNPFNHEEVLSLCSL